MTNVNHGARSGQRAIRAWAMLGLAACVLLPWYFPQDLRLVAALRGVWGPEPTAAALVQVGEHGRTWLGGGVVALMLALAAGFMPAGRAQGRVLLVAAALGLLWCWAAASRSGSGAGTLTSSMPGSASCLEGRSAWAWAVPSRCSAC